MSSTFYNELFYIAYKNHKHDKTEAPLCKTINCCYCKEHLMIRFSLKLKSQNPFKFQHLNNMDIPLLLKTIGSGEVDPASGNMLLLVSWHMRVPSQNGIGICECECTWPTVLPSFQHENQLLPSELSVQGSDSFSDMQIKLSSLLEQSFIVCFEVHVRTHLALSQPFKYILLPQQIASTTDFTDMLNLGLVQLRLSGSIIKVHCMIDHDRFEDLCSLDSQLLFQKTSLQRVHTQVI